MIMDLLYTPLELKFTDGAPAGTFSGYGAVFGNTDTHGDVIKPGAFAESIADHKAEGRSVPMHLMHRVYGGDGLPVGVWTKMDEDDHGLKVDGKISGMNTDGGKLLYERVKDGAFGGLSIGYKVKPGGAVLGKEAGDPKRTLTNLDLKEISLVDSPSNARSTIDEVKAALMAGDRNKAADAVAAAMRLHDKNMNGAFYEGANVKDRAVLMNHLRDAHEALTGQRAPDGLDGWKAMPTTIREFESWLREEFKLSHAEARSIAENGFKSSLPRDEEVDPANSADALLRALLTD
jgi:HK97 family phage prohead protease